MSEEKALCETPMELVERITDRTVFIQVLKTIPVMAVLEMKNILKHKVKPVNEDFAYALTVLGAYLKCMDENGAVQFDEAAKLAQSRLYTMVRMQEVVSHLNALKERHKDV